MYIVPANPNPRVRRSATREIITLSKPIARKGEGTVYRVTEDSSLAAKIYHPAQQTSDRFDKLRYMMAHPPEVRSYEEHCPLAWPSELLLDLKTGGAIGFLMPYIASDAIHDFYSPGSRPANADYRFSHGAALNFASLVDAVHSSGEYVIGDINLSNVAVDNRALVTLWDCDSFQVREQGGKVHLCHVAHSEYAPPELNTIPGNGGALRTPDQDNFSLAVLLYQLLMQGYNPFYVTRLKSERKDADFTAAGIGMLEALLQGYFAYDPKAGFPLPGNPTWGPPPLSPPFTILPSQIRDLFMECFVHGHSEPSLRPTAKQWKSVLARFKLDKSFQHCEIHNKLPRNHWYYKDQERVGCPWCAARFDPYDPPITIVPKQYPSASNLPESPVSPSESNSLDNDLIVAKRGSGAYRTIAAALAASSGQRATIHVGPGVYQESLKIEQSVTIHAEQGTVELLADANAPALTLAGPQSSVHLIGLDIRRTSASSGVGVRGGASAPGLVEMTAGARLRIDECRLAGENGPALILSAPGSRVSVKKTYLDSNATSVIAVNAFLHLDLAESAVAGSPDVAVNFTREAGRATASIVRSEFSGFRRVAIRTEGGTGAIDIIENTTFIFGGRPVNPVGRGRNGRVSVQR